VINNPTRFLPIAKAVLFGAVRGGVEVAASTFFLGAGPVVSKALEPVLDALERKLGIDPTQSPENAQRAAELLERDQALQGLLEQQLALVITPLRDSAVALDEGQRRLLMMAEVNQAAIGDVAKLLSVTNETLTRGIEVAPGSIDTIALKVTEQVISALDTREQAEAAKREKRERRFKEHVARTQARAVELVREKQFDRAADELKAGLELLESMLEAAPGDTHLVVQLGFFFKTLAQEFDGQGVRDEAEDYNNRALELFQRVAFGTAHSAKSVRDFTDALNGLGNIHYARGHYRAAANHYRLATAIDPSYAYAWHDLVGALYELAKQGDAQIGEARAALDMARRTGSGQPGLGKAYLDGLGMRLDSLEAWLASPAGKAQSASQTGRSGFLQADEHTRAAKRLIAQNNAEAALRELDKALRLYPRSVEARSARGALLVGLGRIEDGLAEIDRVIAAAPDYPEPHYNRACALTLKGERQGALRALARAVAVPWLRRSARLDPHLASLRDDPELGGCFQALLGED
jgi:tetratricopeptide (TPR) repeat protein